MDIVIRKIHDGYFEMYHYSKERAKLINKLTQQFGVFAFAYKENRDATLLQYDSILMVSTNKGIDIDDRI